MAILANLRGLNLFSSPPSKPPRPTNNNNNNNNSKPPPLPPPIPIPKYPPPYYKSPQRTSQEKNQNQNPPTYQSSSSSSPALKTFHRRTKYYKPVSEGVLTSDGDRSVVIGESGVSYLLPGAPFEFQFSYSETPKIKPLAIREPAFLPFAPPTMPRPWTGRPPLKKSKKNIPLFESLNPTPPGTKGVKHVEMPNPIELGKYPKEVKTREEILGERLTKAEIRMLIQPHLSHNRQVNLGRDGLTHNMLELVHSHWKRDRVCKVRCLGVPTVDMDNVCKHLEEKTGGKIIHRIGGVVCLFRGRNYNYRTRPQYPVMLWKPATPVYPKLIQEAPEGLTKFEADHLRAKGKNLLPICKLAKNGVYINLVKDVREAFEGSILVKIDCKRMHASDYKKLGAKLKDLVPCVLLSFDDEQILMWRGKEWKSMYPEGQSPVSVIHPSNNITSSSSDCRREKDASNSQNALFPTPDDTEQGNDCRREKDASTSRNALFPTPDDTEQGNGKTAGTKSRPSSDCRREKDASTSRNALFSTPDDTEQGNGNSSSEIQRPDTSMPVSSPRMLSLWKRALESNKALLLDKIDLGPDELLEKVEAFSGTLQVTEHSYPALIMSSNSDTNTSDTEHEDGSEIDDYDDEDDFDVYEEDDGLFEDAESVPHGSLPVDHFAEQLNLDS